MNRILADFSANRLGGEPVPDDVKALLANRDEFLERTGVELNWESNWAPWLDLSYLTAEERAKPDIAANIKASDEVIGLIAFVGAEEDGNYFGYWRGPKKRPIAKSPIVCLDNEGQFRIQAGYTFAQAILVDRSFGDEEQFTELRDWFNSIGVKSSWKISDDATWSEERDSPGELHKKLFYKHLGTNPKR